MVRVATGAGTKSGPEFKPNAMRRTAGKRANRESANLEIWFLFSPKGYNIKNKWSPNRLPTQRSRSPWLELKLESLPKADQGQLWQQGTARIIGLIFNWREINSICHEAPFSAWWRRRGVASESERQQEQSTGRCVGWQMEKQEKNVFNVERQFRSAKAK